MSTNVKKGATNVTVDTPVTVEVADGTLQSVVVKAAQKKPLAGAFNNAKTEWKADGFLEPGMTYLVKAKASRSAGNVSISRSTFTTQDLSLDQQTYPSLTPLQNEVVGVGMPVIVQFDIPVKNKAAFESRMRVETQPSAAGSWNWISDQEVHWRPKNYWKPGTTIHVAVDVNGVNAGNGVYGQMNRSLDFKIGRAVIMKTDLASEQMRVMIDGALARTIPITGGKSGFETRSGTKLIVEKIASKRMDAATVGTDPADPEYYNIPNVKYAQRVTFSGEFIHAAPWSVASQGFSNVSHGCVGMSTENGAWLFGVTHRGDPVEVTGTQRGLEDNNGWTDWNESFKDYRAGSAL
ncbi:MAG: Ig-like domain-containing protein [Nocardioidaceae bacterium]